MPEIFCPLSKVAAVLHGDGQLVDQMLEFSKTNRCKGCTQHKSSNLPLYLSVLVHGNQVAECREVSEE